MFLVTCNNCGGVFDDTNPGEESKEYGEDLRFVFDIDELRNHKCPKCGTDGYLVDNINGNAGGRAQEIRDYIGPEKEMEFFDED